MNLKAEDYREMDRRSLWHPYTRRSAADRGDLPLITRGEGIYLYDASGNAYLDAISSWWACNLGHGHPRLVEAIRKQAGELQHSILGNLSHPRAVELAAGLAELFPGPRHVMFAGDGASAVEAALKIAVQYWYNLGRPERNRFASLEYAYHGDTLGAVSVGYLEDFHRPFKELLFAVHRAESPCCSRCRHGKEPNSCGQECFESMRAILDRHADKLAAVIVEPLCQAAAGMRIYSPQYLRRLEDLCREKEVLLILDEVAMGFGRTGEMFAFEHGGLDPDVVCLGKGLSGGYLPMSATVVKDGVFEAFRDGPGDGTFYHGHTFAGNPIAAAAGVETLKIYEEEGIIEQARLKASLLRDRMAGFGKLPHVADIRHLGMIGAVELDGDGSRGQRIRGWLLKRGILLRPLGNVVYLMLPLVTPEDALIQVVETLGEAIKACA